jgi:hypothetical protein
LHYRDERYITASFKSFWVSKPFGCWKKVARKKGIAVGTGNIASIFSLLVALAAVATPALATKNKPTTRPVNINLFMLHDQLVADLTSSDDARAASAVSIIKSYVNQHPSARAVNAAFALLHDAKRDADIQSISLDFISRNPGFTSAIISFQWHRTQAFLDTQNPTAALSAAKAYFNIVELKDTAGAVDLISRCLTAARPEDPDAASRFRAQQVAGAAANPEPPASTAPPSDSVLASIPIDPAPFADLAEHIQITTYGDAVARGNLLLLAGKPTDARAQFEIAQKLAPKDRAAEAVSNVARAIRAQSGSVGPANAYILELRAGQS